MDWQLVLFHPPGSEPAAASRAAARRQRRRMAGPWRRLLPHDEIPGGAGADAGQPDLVQMGSLHDLAVWLRPAGAGLLSRRRPLPDRQIGARSHRRAGGGHCVRQPRGRVARLRGTVPIAARQSRGGAGPGRLCFSRGADLWLHPRIQRARRVHPDRRADRHDHGGECVRHHHSLSEEVGRRDARRQRLQIRAGARSASNARYTTII